MLLPLAVSFRWNRVAAALEGTRKGRSMTATYAPPTEGEPLGNGTLNAAISNAVVQLMRESTGRGPTKARTSIRDDVVLVMLEHVLTKAESRLAALGQADKVIDLRGTIQESMRVDLVSAVERLTGRRVRAFMSTNHADPDIAAELFVLEPLSPDRDAPSVLSHVAGR